MDKDVLVKLVDVSRTYIMGEVEVKALLPTTFEIYSGELLCILGPSGSGKSTLLNILGGMDQPTAGDVYFQGKNLSQATEVQMTSYRRNQVGFVFQFYNLIPDLTARENVDLAASLVDNPHPTREVMREVGLEDRMDHFPTQLSGGEQQRTSIARALIKNPRLILCDEPTGALDFETGKMVLSLLARVNREHNSTLIMVTHNTPLSAMADRTIRMRSGRIAEVIVNENPVSPERIEW
ncbi:MAG: ABC transporter ATP-binding protein [Acidobacteriota bacterium]